MQPQSQRVFENAKAIAGDCNFLGFQILGRWHEAGTINLAEEMDKYEQAEKREMMLAAIHTAVFWQSCYNVPASPAVMCDCGKLAVEVIGDEQYCCGSCAREQDHA